MSINLVIEMGAWRLLKEQKGRAGTSTEGAEHRQGDPGCKVGHDEMGYRSQVQEDSLGQMSGFTGRSAKM